jgi:histidine triad (HIT) family protein
MTYKKSCPFCNKDVIHNQKLWETDTEYVFYNIRKTNRGRCLVVPKRHVENIRELTGKEAGSLFQTIQSVSQVLSEYLKPVGINYGFNEGQYAGQMISHFHFHILPRFENDPVLKYHLFHGDPQNKSDLTQNELDKLVTEFRKIFKDRKKAVE